MEESKNGDLNVSQNDIMNMVKETSELAAGKKALQLGEAAIAAQTSNALTNNVEFWKWMNRNYSGSGIFNSAETMNQYIAQGAGKEEWLIKQLQGKGYEWDWMTAQRGDIKNIFKTYNAGDVANRAASDVTEKNIFTGKSTEYQMKAYTSKSNPDLKNTPKDMTVVTNAEKVDVVKGNGYENVQQFQDSQTIKKNTNDRLEQIKSGKAYTTYNIKNVSVTMAKAGVVGCVIGLGTEAIVSYKSWKSGQLSDDEYLKEILKAGGDAGLTAGTTAGLMVPVSAAITAAGASSLITIPVAFIVGGVVNKVIAPCFGRGQYKQILSNVKYYQSLENVYDDLTDSMQRASEEYYDFVLGISRQNMVHQELKKQSMMMNDDLKHLYDSI
ncbi:hypothetical protein GPL15_01295 [Clostridium sp. MCC353]|uniref:hypothetical protein n=1 Tax=Clostridium sp. MCC353 TaxID=2592646 RepID=UPI001C029294|nr:hypothetical protein [Clostridium sp. MCC353]MBT9775140.1 hypothetical protein [Clostridium sp. MCC353]